MNKTDLLLKREWLTTMNKTDLLLKHEWLKIAKSYVDNANSWRASKPGNGVSWTAEQISENIQASDRQYAEAIERAKTAPVKIVLHYEDGCFNAEETLMNKMEFLLKREWLKIAKSCVDEANIWRASKPGKGVSWTAEQINKNIASNDQGYKEAMEQSKIAPVKIVLHYEDGKIVTIE